MQFALSLDIISPEAPASPRPDGLLNLLLREQRQTAADRFAQWHRDEPSPLQERYYRDLVPLSLPAAGEQYAFEVDLDACSGCKACVAACHNLNGLDEEETWRSVGLLHGGSSQSPVLQHVTTACHHCLEPACLDGCPVEAYEKDPVTGIVRHLDDQCIGCRYCMLKCPYDVPKYSHEKGIVRKCDMCSQRLAVGEAPACVQACPNQAIRITLVNRESAAESAEANLFLPGAPEPGYTLPTTVYKTAKAFPANMLPADYYSATPQRAHWPLVLMLLLTQMSVGAFLVDQVLMAAAVSTGHGPLPAARTLHLAAAFALGMLGLGASVFHLGRPWLAWRAVIGWRTSWLSREVIAFGGFALSASVYAAAASLDVSGEARGTWVRALGALVAVSGAAGVFCSTMIYASTRRPFWSAGYTGLKFALTSLVLGIPVALLIQLTAGAWISRAAFEGMMRGPGIVLSAALLAACAAKLLVEAAVFCWLTARTYTPLRRTAMLLTGELARVTWWRFLAGGFGGLVIPAILLGQYSPTGSAAPGSLATVAVVVLMLAACSAGELLERYLFFAAVVAPKMPGSPAA